MSVPYLGEIKVVSFNFAPKGWALCNGQLMPINQNQALFSILGTTYGGDGRQTFALPNLQGRAAVHVGAGVNLGQLAGEASHTLTVSELPAHVHSALGTDQAPNQGSPVNNAWAKNTGVNTYGTQPNSAMNSTAVAPAGGSQPHENRQPFLILTFIIALQGIYPSQN
jgi:microcystin-dependent protein